MPAPEPIMNMFSMLAETGVVGKRVDELGMHLGG